MGSKNTKKERERVIIERHSDIRIPHAIFRNTSLSIMEAIVDYLKTDHGLMFCEIAAILDRDERNVWTVYNRAQKKK